jgi:hypothetical protein
MTPYKPRSIPRYVLFGARNDIAQTFLRKARYFRYQVLCLHPHKTPGPNGIDDNLLIRALGGTPLRYSFRDETTGSHSYHQTKCLASLLIGTDGVVWAAHPSRRETSYTQSYHRDLHDRFEDYIQDLGHLLNVMEIGKIRKFVCLSVCPEERHIDKLMDPAKTKMLDECRQLARDVEELVASKKRVEWSVVTSPGFRKDGVGEEASGDAGRDEERYQEWVDGIVRTMVDTLRSPVGDETLGTEVNSPNAQKAKTPNKPSTPITTFNGMSLPSSTDILASVLACRKIPSPLSHSDPILSPINAQNFPNHFSQQSSTFTPSMSKLLEDVRTGREQSNSRLHEERKYDEALIRQRQIARLEAQMKGLPPPGADFQMLLRVLNATRPQPSKLKTGNNLKRTTINLHPMEGRSRGLQRDVASTAATRGETEGKAGATPMERGEVIRNAWKKGDFGRVREALEDKGEGLFKTLADVLLDPSPATEEFTSRFAGQTRDMNHGRSDWNSSHFDRGTTPKRRGGGKS